MTTQGHAAAMRQCIADSCMQGRAPCKTPMQCSGAAPLVDESIQHWQLHRLQEVEAVETRWTEPRPSRYSFAPGVIQGPDVDRPIYTPIEAGLLTSRVVWIAALLSLAVWSGFAWWLTR